MKLIAPAFAAVLLLAGCSSFDYEGTWTGSHSYQPGIHESEGVSATLSKVELRIHSGTYELVEAGVPRSGVIASEDGGLTLWVTSMARHKSKPMLDGQVKPVDSNTVRYVGPGLDQTPVLLKRTPPGS